MEELKSNSSSAQKAVTLQDVEDGAVHLREVGEALAALKGKRGHVTQTVVVSRFGHVISV